jgi:putative membrane protein
MILLLDTIYQAGVGSMLVNTLLMALVLMGGSYLLTGVEVKDFTRAVILAIVLALLNATLGRIMDFIAFPLRLLTLGLFSLVIDAILLMVAAYFLKGFSIKSFGWAILLAVFMAVANIFLHIW